jgi:hypothetical protein
MQYRCSTFLIEMLVYYCSKKNMNKICTMGLQYPQNLVASNSLHLSNTMRITKDNTNLRWCQTFLCKLADIVVNLCDHDKNKLKKKRIELVWITTKSIQWLRLMAKSKSSQHCNFHINFTKSFPFDAMLLSQTWPDLSVMRLYFQ